nr:hypothetical protein CFP56_19819 [Quercus suber]
MGLCIAPMHAYGQAVITLFNEELLGGYAFSLVPSEGLDTESIFVYHLMSEEAPIAIDILMEGFFNGVDTVAKAMASATATTTKKVLAEASAFPSRPISAEEVTPIVG